MTSCDITIIDLCSVTEQKRTQCSWASWNTARKDRRNNSRRNLCGQRVTCAEFWQTFSIWCFHCFSCRLWTKEKHVRFHRRHPAHCARVHVCHGTILSRIIEEIRCSAMFLADGQHDADDVLTTRTSTLSETFFIYLSWTFLIRCEIHRRQISRSCTSFQLQNRPRATVSRASHTASPLWKVSGNWRTAVTIWSLCLRGNMRVVVRCEFPNCAECLTTRQKFPDHEKNRFSIDMSIRTPSFRVSVTSSLCKQRTLHRLYASIDC